MVTSSQPVALMASPWRAITKRGSSVICEMSTDGAGGGELVDVQLFRTSSRYEMTRAVGCT